MGSITMLTLSKSVKKSNFSFFDGEKNTFCEFAVVFFRKHLSFMAFVQGDKLLMGHLKMIVTNS